MMRTEGCQVSWPQHTTLQTTTVRQQQYLYQTNKLHTRTVWSGGGGGGGGGVIADLWTGGRWKPV